MSALYDINRSRPGTDKRLPAEVLILIHKEVHVNPTYEKIHSTWTSITQDIIFTGPIPKGRYYFDITPEEMEQGHVGFGGTVSSGDFLYRLRCFSPNIYIHFLGREADKAVWYAGIKHNQSGVILMFSEHKASLSVYVVQGHSTINMSDAEPSFTPDVVELLPASFKMINGTRRLTYFHPAADANSPAADEHYLAVPAESLRDRVGSDEEDLEFYDLWNPVKITSADFLFPI
ncbi:hypothetical protein Clacol_010287 [Clathrus columnatus]|uniref:Uncharacterized protein n=1 Tax=Clathrus columnatus TaxID=1419009 RepID=A0AAV5AR64_9AGAM|nr:hypothetical protein Clacol_010287 [Clathrus columnatus]